MRSESRIIALSQRVVEVPARGEVRDCLDQQWAVWLQSIGFTAVPIPNRLKSVEDLLRSIRPAGIILSGGNNVTLPVYDGVGPEAGVADAYESRDRTEQAMVEFALHQRTPLLGCCHGMQFLHVFFGGRLQPLKRSPVEHVANNHEVTLIDERFRSLAGLGALTVNSFHDYGIHRDAVVEPLVPLGVSPADGSVEAFLHRALPIIGVMWHPERPNPAATFDRELAVRLFDSNYFRLHET